MPPKEITFTLQEQEVIDMEIDKLLIKGVISETRHCPGEYISTIFIVFIIIYLKSHVSPQCGNGKNWKIKRDLPVS